jgi:hypothetical protein
MWIFVCSVKYGVCSVFSEKKNGMTYDHTVDLRHNNPFKFGDF